MTVQPIAQSQMTVLRVKISHRDHGSICQTGGTTRATRHRHGAPIFQQLVTLLSYWFVMMHFLSGTPNMGNSNRLCAACAVTAPMQRLIDKVGFTDNLV